MSGTNAHPEYRNIIVIPQGRDCRERLQQCRAHVRHRLRADHLHELGLDARDFVVLQLGRLVPKRFMATTPWTQLQHFPRYLKAITLRLDKLRADPARDTTRLAGSPAGWDAERVLAFKIIGAVAGFVGDIVLLHDPQTAGLVSGLQEAGARVLWRCHVGRDDPHLPPHRADRDGREPPRGAAPDPRRGRREG